VGTYLGAAIRHDKTIHSLEQGLVARIVANPVESWMDLRRRARIELLDGLAGSLECGVAATAKIAPKNQRMDTSAPG
jgi:hypothetical protein